ncbi:MAG: glycoside hydrolase family 3 N-terminal domain-containing protein [Planctomycetota bacterium]
MSFRDPSLPREQRVRDLVSQLTLEEKCGQMLHEAKPIERLGIPAYNWWNEGLHGVARAGRATVFPQAINLGATFAPELIGRVASAIGDEGRAKYHAAAANDSRARYQGLTYWSPNVNIFRDPRWGRGHETYGEDPYLTGQLGCTFVGGLQGDDREHLKIAACAKHYAVHSGPEPLRHVFDVKVSDKDLHETYLPAFRSLVVDAGVMGVMGAYNRVDGHPCCAHPVLMDDILREQWQFDGYFTSDCWAIRDFHEHQKVTKNFTESAALAVKHGCDLNCGVSYDHLLEAIDEGLITEADIDVCVTRLMDIRVRLGMFDPEPEGRDWHAEAEAIVRKPEHTALACEAAQRSLVLLKNHDNILPLSRKDTRHMLLVGALATDVDVMLGNYFGTSSHVVTVYEGLAAAADVGCVIDYWKGCLLSTPNLNPHDWSLGTIAETQVVVAALGISPMLEGEEGEALASDATGDRPNLGLPPNQLQYLRDIREKTARHGKPLVVVLFGGSAICEPELDELADAILWVGYPGEQGGTAIADVIFGNVSPSGRLPFTWYESGSDLPPFDNYNMYPADQGGTGNGRTYRYFTGTPKFPFGYGLSYAPIRYASAKAAGPQHVEVELTNDGDRAVTETVQAYVRLTGASVPTPRWALAGLASVPVEAGASAIASIELSERALGVVGNDGVWSKHDGGTEVYVGPSSPISDTPETGQRVQLRG